MHFIRIFPVPKNFAKGSAIVKVEFEAAKRAATLQMKGLDLVRA